MTRFAYFHGLIIVTGLLYGTSCGDKRQLPGTTGTSGTGGGNAGAGGTGGAGGAVLTSCPTPNPNAYANAACSGTFACDFQDGCTCHGCCSARWTCALGVFKLTDYNDSCGQGPPCPDGGGGSGGTTGAGGSGGDCPASRPTTGTTCSGSYSCNFNDTCRCGVCCYSTYRCRNGTVEFLGSTDACQVVTCDAGATTDASTRVCTPGADQTCNDNPAVSSIHGTCTDAGTCICNVGAGHNPESGKCL